MEIMLQKVRNQFAPAQLLCLIGAIAVVAGGLLSAVTAPRATYTSAWAVAYMVLVVGVIQMGLGVGLTVLPSHALAWRIMLPIVVLLNVANAAVIGGTVLKDTISAGTLIVDAGGALLAIAAVLCLLAVRGAKHSWWLATYYAIILIILVSMPTGLVLVRH